MGREQIRTYIVCRRQNDIGKKHQMNYNMKLRGLIESRKRKSMDKEEEKETVNFLDYVLLFSKRRREEILKNVNS